MQHVRSHVRGPGNELADWLADGGAEGGWQTGQAMVRAAVVWLRGWLAQQSGSGRPPGDQDGRGPDGDG